VFASIADEFRKGPASAHTIQSPFRNVYGNTNVALLLSVFIAQRLP